MCKIKKIILLIPVLIFFVLTIPCEAKSKNDGFELEWVDVGDGIRIPKNFDVVDENGNYVKYLMNLSDFDVEPAGDRIEKKLPNGYTVIQDWILYVDEYGRWYDYGWKQIIVKNEKDETICVMGLDQVEGGMKFRFGLQDEKGNRVEYLYSQTVQTPDGFKQHIDPVEEGPINQQDPGYCYPLKQYVWSAENDTCKQYIAYGDEMKLNKISGIDEDGDYYYAQYSLVYKDEAQVDGAKLLYSYKDKHMQHYFLSQLHETFDGKFIYKTSAVYLPAVITKYHDGVPVDYYYYEMAYKNKDRFSEEELKVLGEKGDETYGYFTKEQIEILKRENLTDPDDIEAKYPEFFESPEDEIIYEDLEDAEYVSPDKEALEAIVTKPVEEETEEQSENTSEVQEGAQTTASNNVFNQELTGDVVEINGRVPYALLTFIENTPAGEQIKLQLVDENYSTIATGSAFDTNHTGYKYAYLTYVDIQGSNVFFMVAGSDTAISGNLNYAGSNIYVVN